MSTPGTPRRGVLGVVRLIARIALIVVLVVLLSLIAIRQAPAIAAAISGPSKSPSAPAANAPSAASAVPSESAASPVATPSSPALATAVATGGTPSGGGTTGGSGTTSGGSGSGGSAPQPTKVASHAPVAPSVAVDSLSAPSVSCPTPSQAPDTTAPPPPSITISWSSTGAVKAWIGVETSDAKANPYSSVDPDGSISLNWPCPSSSQRYTITVESASGTDVSKTVTAHNTGYTG